VTARFELPGPEEMSDGQRRLHRFFSTGPRADPSNPFRLVDDEGRLQGPPAIWLLSAPLGEALQRFGYSIRFELGLSARAQEIAILMVAHDRESPFELYAHTRAGAAAGLGEEDLAALADRGEPALHTAEERAVFETTRRLLERGTLKEDEYEAAAQTLTPGGLFELVTLVGYYEMVAAQLAVFGVEPPDDDG
jgi:4-carboxymuconolactone decarboxylase